MPACRNFAQLRRQAREGIDYRVRHRAGNSGILVIAPHGGGIEPGTGRLADAVAGRQHAFFSFEGLRPSGNRALHITSHRFDEPRAERMLRTSHWILAIHGCRESAPVIWIGGRDSDRGKAFMRILRQAGMPARISERPSLSGQRPDNLCNRGRSGAGVQLELSLGLRRMLFSDLDRRCAGQATPVFHGLVVALQQCLQG